YRPMDSRETALRSPSLDRTFGAAAAVLGVLNAGALATNPFVRQRPSASVLIVVLAVSLLHAAAYWFGPTLRARLGATRYILAQACLVVVLGFVGSLTPYAIVLLCGLTAAAVVYCGERWGVAFISVLALTVLGVLSFATANMYKAAMSGLVLAGTAF